MAVRDIRIAIFYQSLDDFYHLLNMLCCARFMRWAKAAQRAHIVMEPLRHLAGKCLNGNAALYRGCINFIIHIGDIANIRYVQIEMFEQAVEHIIHHHRARIADMRPCIDRRPADIHFHIPCIRRSEFVLAARECVVEF